MKNLKFTIEVNETYKDKEPIERGEHRAVCCLKCEENCHYPGCTWALDPSWCEVMKDGRCTSCSGKCPAEDHVKQSWRYVTKTRLMSKTSAEIQATYEKIEFESQEKITLLESMEKVMVQLQESKKDNLSEAFLIIEQLEKIALNENSVSTYEHLQYLIEKMTEVRDTQKVESLQRLRDQMDEKNKSGAKYFMKLLQDD